MSTRQLSAETVHATAVAIGGRAVLITGRSGAGKSDLALRLLDCGFSLVSDDQTVVRREGDRLAVAAPPTIAGKLEVRGIGIVDIDHIDNVPLALVVELSGDIERLPDDDGERTLLGLPMPMVRIDAMQASAPFKVRIALDRLGLPAR